MPSKDELAAMERFHDLVTELKKGPFAEHVFTKKTGLQVTFGEGAGIKLSGPSKHEVNDMILFLRLVIFQDQDGVSLPQMYDIVRKFPESPERAKMMEWIEGIQKWLKQDALGVVHDQTTDPETNKPWMPKKWSNRDLLENVIYGERAHRNPAMERLMKHIRRDPMTSAFLDTAFHGVAGNLLNGLFAVQFFNAKLYEQATGKGLDVWQRPSGSP